MYMVSYAVLALRKLINYSGGGGSFSLEHTKNTEMEVCNLKADLF